MLLMHIPIDLISGGKDFHFMLIYKDVYFSCH